MPGGERLWRTEAGDLVPDGHEDAVRLAYGEDDDLREEDVDQVREIPEPEKVEPEKVEAPATTKPASRPARGK